MGPGLRRGDTLITSRHGAELVRDAAAHDIDGLPAALVEQELAVTIVVGPRPFDRTEVVMQVLDTSDPVGGAKAQFAAAPAAQPK